MNDDDIKTEEDEKTPEGRFEVNNEDFKETVGNKEILTFDLKIALPDLFTASDMVPKILEPVWRRALDDMLSDTKGIYTYNNNHSIPIFFQEIPPATGKAKITSAIKNLPQLLEDVKSGKIDLSKQSEAEKKASNSAIHEEGPSELEKLIKKGLGDNPHTDVINLWMDRVVQELMTTEQKMPLVKEMMTLISKSDIAYMPLWSVSNQMKMGSIPVIRSSVPSKQYNKGEMIRQDLAVLFGVIFQLYSLASKGLQPLIVIPIKFANLSNARFIKLYNSFLNRVSPNIRKNILFEFRDVPKGNVSDNIKKQIETIGNMGRAYMFESGLLSYTDYKKIFPKLYACGFDCLKNSIPKDDFIRLSKKFSDYYSETGLKTYIKMVDNNDIIKSGVELNFTYISGPAISEPKKISFNIKKLSLDEIVK